MSRSLLIVVGRPRRISRLTGCADDRGQPSLPALCRGRPAGSRSAFVGSTFDSLRLHKMEPKGGIELSSAEADDLRGTAVPSSVQPLIVCVSIKWSRRAELNRRPTHYECVALPLSYSGKLLRRDCRRGVKSSRRNVSVNRFNEG